MWVFPMVLWCLQLPVCHPASTHASQVIVQGLISTQKIYCVHITVLLTSAKECPTRAGSHMSDLGLVQMVGDRETYFEFDPN